MHLNMLIKHMSEDQQVEQCRQYGCCDSLETDLPESQALFVEQGLETFHGVVGSRSSSGS